MVNNTVLIPRPDTEILVEQAIQRIAIDSPTTMCDLGTGSGAIALSVAKERPLATVLAIDSHPSALQLAEQNAKAHQLTNVHFLCSDWFSQLASQKFDLIASNPPYIQSQDPHLQQGDLRFEPSSALIGATDGLGDIRNIIKQASDYLTHNGQVLVEHGYDQAESVHNLFAAAGYTNIINYRDLNNLPRCTAAQWNS